jgi:hypothetical protein
MGFWPFGATKKSRKRDNTKSDQNTSLLEKEKPDKDLMARHADSTPEQSPRSNRQQPAQGSQESVRKLSKPRPPYHAYASSATGSSNARGAATTPRRNSYLNPNMSQSSIGPENFTATPAIPTLHATRPNYDPAVLRKKSSKRKAEDHAREKELRAMSAPIPIPKPKRPATYSGSGPLRRDTQRVPGTLRRPSSQVSLPIPENISELEESLYQNNFKVGIFAALSPRPTIKYGGRSHSNLGKQPVRLEPVAQSLLEDEEEDLSTSRKRIADLADDLDSAGLRELMDRDRKRREKKKEGDKAKLQKKLQRRAEKQREEETRRTRTEEFARSSQAELQKEPSKPEVEHSSTNPEGASAANPFIDPEQPTREKTREIRNPFADEADIDVMQDQIDAEEAEQGPVAVSSQTRKVAAVNQLTEPQAMEAAVSPPLSPIRSPVDERNLSQVSFKKEGPSTEAAAGLERVRKNSDQNVVQQGSSWTSFFKRGSRRKDTVPDRGRVTPSEFSNTSRESFARKPPPQLVTSQRTFRQSATATPQRTMSKFREDLPEYPTPPDSRMQSPEATSTQPVNIRSPTRQLAHSQSGTLDEAASSNQGADRGRPDSRVHSLMSGDSEFAGHALSQSLASVDSEGSWLSGKPVKRSSGPMSPRHLEPSQKPDEMEEAIASDEYLSRLSPEPEERRQSAISGRRPSSTAFDLQKAQSDAPPVPAISQTTDQGETWHGSVGRQPTVVKPASRAKSREGLLKDFQSAEPEVVSDEENESPKSEEEATIMRARSVDYGNKGHARKISAGSAKMLDLRRTSVQSVNTPPRSPAMRSANALAAQRDAS